MLFTHVILLAVVQGLTEFLPVSSSGHLAFIQNLLGIAPPVELDVLLHLGTLTAIIWYFRRRLHELWQKKHDSETKRYLWCIFLGSIPAALAGVFLEPYLGFLFSSLTLVGGGLVFTGILLFLAREKKKTVRLGFGQALKIGFFQALALVPGLSRSGATIGSGLLFGLPRQQAFEFSFLLAIPATLGAAILTFRDFAPLGSQLFSMLTGLFISAVVGLLALSWLEKVLKKGNLNWLAGYCLFFGLLLVLVSSI